MSEGIKCIATKLAKVMGDINFVKNDAHNKDQNYGYASDEAVLIEVKNALAKNNVASKNKFVILSDVDGMNANNKKFNVVKMECILTAIDGDSGEMMESNGFGAGMDYGGDKALAKAQTISHKYAWLKLLNMPTGNNPEADEDVDKEARAAQAAAAKAAANRAANDRAAADKAAANKAAAAKAANDKAAADKAAAAKASADNAAKAAPSAGGTVTELKASAAQRTELVELAGALGMANIEVKDLIKLRCGVDSSKDMSVAQADELLSLLKEMVEAKIAAAAGVVDDEEIPFSDQAAS